MNTKRISHASLSAIVVATVLSATASIAATENEIPYNPNFVQLVEQGKIRSAEIIKERSGSTYIRAAFVETEGNDEKTVKVDVIPNDQFVKMLKEKGVPFSFKRQQSPFYQFASILPVIVIYLIWITVVIIVFLLALRLVRAVERIAENTKK